jgi:hypothetical protein
VKFLNVVLHESSVQPGSDIHRNRPRVLPGEAIRHGVMAKKLFLRETRSASRPRGSGAWWAGDGWGRRRGLSGALIAGPGIKVRGNDRRHVSGHYLFCSRSGTSFRH